MATDKTLLQSARETLVSNDPMSTVSDPMSTVGRGRRLAERGMVTAEYAVGILAAVALALVLLKVFTDNSVFTALLKYVTALIGHLSTYIS